MKDMKVQTKGSQQVGILSTGSAIPDRLVSNDDLSQWVEDYDEGRARKSLDEWVRAHFGIRTRYWSNELPSDLCMKAAVNAIKKAGLEVDQIDFLILNTAFGDFMQPTTATETQKKLGMRPDTFAVELNMPCGGPIYGLAMAKAMLNDSNSTYGLVIGVDKMSSLVDKRSFVMASLFGEGAGAAVVSKSGNSKIIDQVLRSSGEVGDVSDFALCVPAGYAYEPTTSQSVKDGKHFLNMNGPKVEKLISSSISEVGQTLMVNNGLNPEDIAYFVPHQASKRAVDKAITGLGIDSNKICYTLEEYGNTSGGSILITLDKCCEKFDSGDNIILAGMGAGLNWGGILVSW